MPWGLPWASIPTVSVTWRYRSTVKQAPAMIELRWSRTLDRGSAPSAITRIPRG